MKQLIYNIIIIIIGWGGSYAYLYFLNKSEREDQQAYVVLFMALAALLLSIINYRYQRNPVNSHRTLSFWFMLVAILCFGLLGWFAYVLFALSDFSFIG